MKTKLITGCFCFYILLVGSLSAQAKPVLPGNSLFFENSNSKKLIVFIHGIKGHPKTTWSHEGESFFWPQELAKEGKFKNADVMSFGYESECAPSANIREIAQELNNLLEVALEKPYQSISFVAPQHGRAGSA